MFVMSTVSYGCHQFDLDHYFTKVVACKDLSRWPCM